MTLCDSPETIDSRITNERVRFVIPTALEWIDRTVNWLEERARQLAICEPEKIHRITVPLHEAITNAMIHGNLEVSSDLKEEESGQFSQAVVQRSNDPRYASRTVEIVFDADPHRVQWIVTDQGPGFDVAAKLAHADSDEVSLLASGRGITMMRAFMDDVYYHHGGRCVVMTRQRSADPSTCRLDDGNRMRELDSLLNSSADLWSAPGAHRAPPAEQPATPGDSAGFDALLDPFLETLLHTAGEAPNQNQRRHARIPYTAELTLRDASGQSFKAFARNISRGGVSFLCEGVFTSPEIELTFPAAAGPVTLRGIIVRATRLIPSITDFGVQFVATDDASVNS